MTGPAQPWPRIEPLETARLLLEPLRVGHAREMAGVLGDPELYRYTGGAPPTEAELSERYERQARGAAPGGSAGWLNWVLRRRGAGPAGYVQATVTAAGPDLSADLAWVVARDAQGEGLATEAAAAVAEWLAGNRVGTLTAHIHPEHAASAAVARRLGMSPTDDRRDGEVRWIASASRA